MTYERKIVYILVSRLSCCCCLLISYEEPSGGTLSIGTDLQITETAAIPNVVSFLVNAELGGIHSK